MSILDRHYLFISIISLVPGKEAAVKRSPQNRDMNGKSDSIETSYDEYEFLKEYCGKSCSSIDGVKGKENAGLSGGADSSSILTVEIIDDILSQKKKSEPILNVMNEDHSDSRAQVDKKEVAEPGHEQKPEDGSRSASDGMAGGVNIEHDENNHESSHEEIEAGPIENAHETPPATIVIEEASEKAPASIITAEYELAKIEPEHQAHPEENLPENNFDNHAPEDDQNTEQALTEAGIGERKKFLSSTKTEARAISDVADASTDQEFLSSVRRIAPLGSRQPTPFIRKVRYSKINVIKHFVQEDKVMRVPQRISAPRFQAQRKNTEHSKRARFTMEDAEGLLHSLSSREDPPSELPQNRYVLGNQKEPSHLKDVVAIEDLKHRTLFDKVLRREHDGGFIECWIQVIHGTIFCYQAEPLKASMGGTSREIFKDPHTGRSHRVGFVLDLMDARLHLPGSVRMGLKSWLCCAPPLLDTDRLIDITEAHIQRVLGGPTKYTVEASFDGEMRMMKIPGLDLIFEAGGYYFYIRVSKIDKFLKWILTYRLRKQRCICRL